MKASLKKKIKRVLNLADKNFCVNPNEIKNILDENVQGRKISLFSPKQVDFIRRRVTKLPEKEFAVVYLRYWKGLWLDEIADTLNISFRRVCELIDSSLHIIRYQYVYDCYRPSYVHAVNVQCDPEFIVCA